MWLFQESGFRRREVNAEYRLREAFETARNRNKIKRRYRELIEPNQSMFLHAASPRSRIRFFRSFCQEFCEHFDLHPHNRYPDQPLFLITIVDVECCVSVDDSEIDIDRIRQRLRFRMPGISFVGCIEPGLYANKATGSYGAGKSAVSWHFHGIAWGLSKSEMRRRIDALEKRGRYLPIADGLAGVHSKPIHPSEFARTLGYPFKSPRNEYRLRKILSSADEQPQFQQFVSTLRKGNQLNLFNQCKALYLDDLLLASGEGVGILAKTMKTALAEFRRRSAKPISRGRKRCS